MKQDLIKKYLEGKCTPEEEQELLQYLEAGKEAALHDEIRSMERTVDAAVPETLSSSLLRDIYNKLPASSSKGRLVSFRKWRIAAGILLLITAGSAATFWFSRQQSSIPVAAQMTELRNNELTVKKATLPDGTSVWLNSRASISFHQNSFNQQDRVVSVKGEAFFDVAANSNKPFRVQTGQLTTLVLGTAFNVENYQQEKNIRITLVQGKVAVEAADKRRELSPGQFLNFNTGKGTMDVHATDTSNGREWLQGRITFNDLALEDVLKRVENMYQVRITCSHPTILNGKRLTGTYNRTKPAELLRKILFVHGLSMKQQPGQFIIHP